MKRYFFYIVFINSINNIIIFLPNVILRDRYNGSLMAIIFAVPYGTFFLYYFIKSIIKFPNKSYPEILKITMPHWVQVSIMLFICMFWYISGFMMLIALIQMIQRFILPYASEYLLLVLIVFIIIFAAKTEGSTVLYALEIFIIIIALAIGFIFIKSILNSNFSWDSCMEVVTHSFTFPTLSSYAVTTYMFSGYTDMIIFNRYFNNENFQFKHIWLIPVLELALLMFAFFIPIGFFGTQGVSSFTYPWVAATDCIDIKIGLIERTMYIYLPVFFLTAVINIIVHWHVSLELIKGMIQYQFNFTNINKISWYINIMFALLPFIFINKFSNENVVLYIGNDWLIFRVFAEPFVVGFLVLSAYIARKKGIV